MSRAPDVLIVGAAPEPDGEGYYASVIAAADVVIAADAGLHVSLAAGRVPNVCVGDFDSVDRSRLETARLGGARIVQHPSRKDVSDLDLALDEARALGARRVTFTAAYSARIDHTIAALGTLLRSADVQGRADEPTVTMYAVQAGSEPLALDTGPGTTFSVFALGRPASVTLRGVRYPLSEHVLEPMSSLGLSNVAEAAEQALWVHDGRVLVCIPRQRS